MSSTKDHLTYALFAVLLIVILVRPVNATAISFSVQAGKVEVKTLSLIADDHVLVRFSVQGQYTNTLDFYMTDPQGRIVQTFSTVTNLNYPFVCSEEGEYKLYFSNVNSSEDKFVSLDYEVQHYMFGMPQMLFLTLIVVGICLAAVAAFVLMGKRQ